MFVLSSNAILKCTHVNGLVVLTTSQDFVTVTEPAAGDRRARKASLWLIDADPEHRTIFGCPNINVGIFPCTLTKAVRQGYSSFVRIGGRRACLGSVTGSTNGSPGVFEYSVAAAGQGFVRCSS